MTVNSTNSGNEEKNPAVLRDENAAHFTLNGYGARLGAASRSLFKSVGGPFALWEAGTELVGIIELRNGKQGQFHLTLVSDENEFLDCDEPTGCADDLVITPADFALANGQRA